MHLSLTRLCCSSRPALRCCRSTRAWPRRSCTRPKSTPCSSARRSWPQAELPRGGGRHRRRAREVRKEARRWQSRPSLQKPRRRRPRRRRRRRCGRLGGRVLRVVDFAGDAAPGDGAGRRGARGGIGMRCVLSEARRRLRRRRGVAVGDGGSRERTRNGRDTARAAASRAERGARARASMTWATTSMDAPASPRREPPAAAERQLPPGRRCRGATGTRAAARLVVSSTVSRPADTPPVRAGTGYSLGGERDARGASVRTAG